MNRHAISRIVSVLVGAAVLFGLEQRLGVKLYFAIPAGVLAYIATLVVLRLLLEADTRTK
jgi:uncharacterized membrane protein